MERRIANTTLTIDETRIEGDISGKIDAYMRGERTTFDEPVDLSDLTAFQQSVMQEIRRIPYGETVTYTGIAESIEKPQAVRAVANACGANPVPIVIPCHRIVAKNGLGGYSSGVAVKKALLELEA